MLDVSERKAAEQERSDLRAEEAATAAKARDRQRLDTAGRERFISLIVEESESLARIVNQILLANQLEVGRLDLVTEPVEAADLLERVVEAARTYAPPEITFDVQAAGSVPPVAADKEGKGSAFFSELPSISSHPHREPSLS